jgi:hypothetical protein
MPKKTRCTFKECKDAAVRIAGDCAFCEGHFCGKHRLLEDHKCDGLEDVSDALDSSFPWWLVGLVGPLAGDLDGDPDLTGLADALEHEVQEGGPRTERRAAQQGADAGHQGDIVAAQATSWIDPGDAAEVRQQAAGA